MLFAYQTSVLVLYIFWEKNTLFIDIESMKSKNDAITIFLSDKARSKIKYSC